MNGTQVLAGEAVVAMAFVAWRNIKGGYAPPTDPHAYQGPKGYSHDNLIMLGPPQTNVPGVVG